MYTTKYFRVRSEEDVLKEIESIARQQPGITKVFLADGNPMVLSTSKLLTILNSINKAFPHIERISTYALPANIASKSTEELKALKDAGLNLLYVGIESGDDEVLRAIHKSETFASTVEGLLKAKEAGMAISAIILNGVGGQKFHRQHAVNSAKILNEIQPEYASSLVLSFPYGIEHYKQRFDGDYIPMSIVELMKETEIFIEQTQLKNTVFRSNHASNYLVLRGVLGRDKDDFLKRIRSAINNPETAGLREEWQRGL